MNKISYIFIQENAFENVVFRMSAIFYLNELIRREITTTSTLVGKWNLLSCLSVAFNRHRALPCTDLRAIGFDIDCLFGKENMQTKNSKQNRKHA